MINELDTNIKILKEALNPQECINWVITPESGGVDVFIGTVRNMTKGKRVVKLEFEAYEIMAINEMTKISVDVSNKWPIKKMLIHHRTGILKVGEIPVIIAVAAVHRDAAFEACRYVIDTLKKTVPIWKKEYFEDGEVWVAAHP